MWTRMVVAQDAKVQAWQGGSAGMGLLASVEGTPACGDARRLAAQVVVKAGKQCLAGRP